jgi:hypothetical protein
MSTYLTIISVFSGRSVPFSILANGEIQIKSSNPLDNDENCIVHVGTVFYEYSIDFQRKYGRV